MITCKLPATSRVAGGVQAGWLDVAQRVAFNVDTASLDYVSPIYYFGLAGDAEAQLKALAEDTTAAYVARLARALISTSFAYIKMNSRITGSIC